MRTSIFGFVNSDMILASDVATVSVSFKSLVVLPLPLGEDLGEGLADATTKTRLSLSDRFDEKEETNSLLLVSPHPDPLPKGAETYFLVARPLMLRDTIEALLHWSFTI